MWDKSEDSEQPAHACGLFRDLSAPIYPYIILKSCEKLKIKMKFSQHMNVVCLDTTLLPYNI